MGQGHCIHRLIVTVLQQPHPLSRPVLPGAASRGAALLSAAVRHWACGTGGTLVTSVTVMVVW